MAANDDRIAVTVKPDNALYNRMHRYTTSVGATHNAFLVLAMKHYLDALKWEVEGPKRENPSEKSARKAAERGLVTLRNKS